MDLGTAPGERTLGQLRRSRALRWVFTAGLVAFLVIGALGGYGVSHDEVTAEGGGYELTVRYPQRTRPGLGSSWSVEVRTVDGSALEGPVVIATDAHYFDLYDENGLDPEPASERTDGDRVVWEVEPAEGATSVAVDLDARIEPGVQLTSRRGTTSVLVDGAPAVTVSYRTRVFP